MSEWAEQHPDHVADTAEIVQAAWEQEFEAVEKDLKRYGWSKNHHGILVSTHHPTSDGHASTYWGLINIGLQHGWLAEYLYYKEDNS